MLTDRELEIVELVAKGYSIKQISKTLNIKEATTRYCINWNIKPKLNIYMEEFDNDRGSAMVKIALWYWKKKGLLNEM